MGVDRETAGQIAWAYIDDGSAAWSQQEMERQAARSHSGHCEAQHVNREHPHSRNPAEAKNPHNHRRHPQEHDRDHSRRCEEAEHDEKGRQRRKAKQRTDPMNKQKAATPSPKRARKDERCIVQKYPRINIKISTRTSHGRKMSREEQEKFAIIADFVQRVESRRGLRGTGRTDGPGWRPHPHHFSAAGFAFSILIIASSSSTTDWSARCFRTPGAGPSSSTCSPHPQRWDLLLLQVVEASLQAF
eukprot:s1834_g12.t1